LRQAEVALLREQLRSLDGHGRPAASQAKAKEAKAKARVLELRGGGGQVKAKVAAAPAGQLPWSVRAHRQAEGRLQSARSAASLPSLPLPPLHR
jgi:hypothetical protein